ncbi:MAG: carboxymuconolactone decarboxylase family protein [Alphaproteobacteria bacterium]|jgi:AhpD family alkylhydroperoxidase|nr:carboxymuconolactone decarboxylase family protein [Alphaproteobacteria bacterium]
MSNGLRFSYGTLSKEAYDGFLATNKALEKSSVGKELIELIYLRVSQINGCSFCLKMHTSSLKKEGISESKLASLAGWHASEEFSDREKVALTWAESLTYINKTHAPDKDFELVKSHFNDTEISDITFAVALMNAFNRLAISARQ